MRYSLKFKIKCVKLYREGKWVKTPKGVTDGTFKKSIRTWDKIARIHGEEALENAKTHRNWTAKEKLEIIKKVIKYNSLNAVAISENISSGMLSKWIHRYKTLGYNGLISPREARTLKEKSMNKVAKKKKRAINTSKEGKAFKSEIDQAAELDFWRTKAKLLEKELKAVKKQVALRKALKAALLKAEKQQSLEDLIKKDMH